MCLGFMWATKPWQLLVLFTLHSIFYAANEAQSKAFIAYLESERRAFAMGLYNALTDLPYLLASLMVEALWLGLHFGFVFGCITDQSDTLSR
ncbi:MAG: MFS family permease [Rhodoferax sp.]|jgi:MFS family permease